MTHESRSAGLAAFRARVARAQGPEYWRSLEELAGTIPQGWRPPIG